MIIIFFWRFFLKKRIYSLKLYIRVKSIPWETLHVNKTLNSLVNFSVNKTYNLPVLFIFRPLSYPYSAGEKLTEYSKFILGNFFCRSVYYKGNTFVFRRNDRFEVGEPYGYRLYKTFSLSVFSETENYFWIESGTHLFRKQLLGWEEQTCSKKLKKVLGFIRKFNRMY